MNGDGDGRGRRALRPPLPRRPSGFNRPPKQREREAPDVDWEHSLHHFAAVVRHDLQELCARFLHEVCRPLSASGHCAYAKQQNVVTFAAWKRLWRDARMSAAFLVEFWESTPTTVHKTILQQTLDETVSCIDEHDGEFESEADVAALIGRVFAMYCAYSVQPGSPKHKIDADPQDWTTMLTIDCVMSGVGAKLFPAGAREVRAMMHQLVAQENAFLRCLQGFGPRVRMKERTARTLMDASRDLSLNDDDTATAKDALVDRSRVEQLKTLDGRYQDLLSRTRSGPSVSNANAGLDARQAKVVVLASRLAKPLSQETGHDSQELTRALASYIEYKANQEARRRDRVVRAAAARDLKSTTGALTLKDDHSVISDSSDHGSVMPTASRAMAVSVTSSRRGSYRRHHSVDDSEAALAELESELHENISSDQVGASRTQPPRKLKRGRDGKSLSTFSEISEADSDALADLEHELEQSFGIGSSQTQTCKAPGKTVTRTNRKHDRKRPSTGIVSRKSTPAALPKVNPARTMNTRLSTKRPRSDSVASSLSIADSWTVSSIADGDGLAALQAELDATPTFPGRQQSTSISCRLTDQAPSFKVRNSTVHDPAAKAKVKQVALQTAVRASGRSKSSVQPEKCGEPSAEQRVKGKPRALSVLSDRSESKGQVQAEIGLTAELITSARTSVAAEPRRSTRLIAMASDTGSDAIDELERELNASALALNAVAPSSSPASVKPAPRKRGTILSKRAAERTCTRSSAKKLQRHEVATSFDGDQPSSAQTSTDSKGTQRVSSIVRQGSSRISSVMSDTESDGLADLMAELDTIATARTSASRPRRKRGAPANRVNTRSTARKKSPASSDDGASRSGTVRSVVSSPVVTLPDPVSPLRRSARLSSVAASETESDDVEGSISDAASTLRRSARLSSLAASDTESDGVEELMAELARGPAVNHAATTEKPKARVRATRKQSSRVQGVKPKQSRAKKEPKAVRAPRVARQAASRKLVAPLSAREPPAAPRNVPSSRRSTRSSSVAFDSGSDDLAELETELQAAYSQR